MNVNIQIKSLLQFDLYPCISFLLRTRLLLHDAATDCLATMLLTATDSCSLQPNSGLCSGLKAFSWRSTFTQSLVWNLLHRFFVFVVWQNILKDSFHHIFILKSVNTVKAEKCTNYFTRLYSHMQRFEHPQSN